MKFYSTRDKASRYTLKEAVLLGLAPDGGLFMPEEIPALPPAIIQNLPEMNFKEIAFELAWPFLKADFNRATVEHFMDQAFTFEAPLKPLTNDLFVLELFHGPTLAFKDFGAQFMAQLLEQMVQETGQELTILVATSGDTGSAVARGFFKKKGIQVVLLYPANRVSEIQEKQLTTIGENVTALEIDGTFDDCQRMVKQAFNDPDLREKLHLTSANSINIARLLPQTFYYAAAFAQLPPSNRAVVVSVPSGNLGNLTAGLMAQQMGIPIHQFVSALNVNDVFLHYLKSGRFNPRTAVPTISNAMDVGNPSNFDRILDLFGKNYSKIKQVIWGGRFSDAQTRQAIQWAYQKLAYLFDPHGAVGFLALQKFLKESKVDHWQAIVLATAHPAKFKVVVEQSCGQTIALPARLAETLKKPKRAELLSKHFNVFKEWLWQRVT